MDHLEKKIKRKDKLQKRYGKITAIMVLIKINQMIFYIFFNLKSKYLQLSPDLMNPNYFSNPSTNQKTMENLNAQQPNSTRKRKPRNRKRHPIKS